MLLIHALVWFALGLMAGVFFYARVFPELMSRAVDDARRLKRDRDELQRDIDEIRAQTDEAIDELRAVHAELGFGSATLVEGFILLREGEADETPAEPPPERPIERTHIAYYDCGGCGVHVMTWAHPRHVEVLGRAMSTCLCCGASVDASHDDLAEEREP